MKQQQHTNLLVLFKTQHITQAKLCPIIFGSRQKKNCSRTCSLSLSFTHAHAHTRARAHTHVHAHTHMCMHTHTHACTQHTHTHTHKTHTCMCMHTHTNTHTHTHKHTQTHIYAHSTIKVSISRFNFPAILWANCTHSSRCTPSSRKHFPLTIFHRTSPIMKTIPDFSCSNNVIFYCVNELF